MTKGRSRGGQPGNDNAVGNNGGAPVGNQNGKKHGVYSDPANLFDALDDNAKGWIAQRIYDYLEIAPFDRSDPRAERLAMTCIMSYQEWKARSEVMAEDMLGQREITDAQGNHVGFVQEEHALSREAHRLNDRIRFNLKELNLIGNNSDISPTNGVTEDAITLAEWLSDKSQPINTEDRDTEDSDNGD